MSEQLGYSVTDAGKQLGGLCRASVYRAVKRGDLELVKVGTRSVITGKSIRALLERPSELEAA